MRVNGIKEIETCIPGRNNTVAHYINTRPIMDLCLEVERRSGSWVPKRWWDQEGLVLPGRQALGDKGGDGYGDGDEQGYTAREAQI